jgi:hypothetical protein
MEDMRELLEEMQETFKSGHHKQVLARMDDEVSFGKVSPILRAVFQFMLGRTPAQHRKEAQRLRRRVRSSKRWRNSTSFSLICSNDSVAYW